MGREHLKVLKLAHEKAQDAYRSHSMRNVSGSSVEDRLQYDIDERTLLKAAVAARNAYEGALDAYVKQPAAEAAE